MIISPIFLIRGEVKTASARPVCLYRQTPVDLNQKVSINKAP